MNKPTLDPLFVSVREAANMLRCSKPELYVYIRAGKLRAKRMGRITKIDFASVHELAESLPDHPFTPGADEAAALEGM